MAQCIVCRASYVPKKKGSSCPRCKSSSKEWDDWRKQDVSNLIKHAGPYLILVALFWGVSMVVGFYFVLTSEALYANGIGPLFVTATLLLSLTAIAGVVLGRYRIRERMLLGQAGTKKPNRWGLGISPVTTILISLLMAFIVGTLAVVTLSLAGAFLESGLSLLQPTVTATPTPQWTPEPQATAVPGLDETPSVAFTESLKKQLEKTLPLYLGFLYLALVVSSVYLLTVMALDPYLAALNQHVPPPIFLQPRLLLKVVRGEVCRYLGANEEDLAWQDFDRTDDGGCKLTVRHRYDSKKIEDTVGRTTGLPMYRKYQILADSWARLRKVKASKEMDV